MRAMILAAGRGQRMGALTATQPKPLLTVAGRSLIQWQLERLKAAGIRDIVINTAYRGAQIVAALGDGRSQGLNLHYSREELLPTDATATPAGALQRSASPGGSASFAWDRSASSANAPAAPEASGLETAGGIIEALPWLGPEPFLVVNADVWCDVDLAAFVAGYDGHSEALLLLVPTPDWKARGDFDWDAAGRVRRGERFTFAGISLLTPALFAGLGQGWRPLAPVLHGAIARDAVQGCYHTGVWADIGTPERLALLAQSLAPGLC